MKEKIEAAGKEYVVITPVKNEEKTIENTILAVLGQKLGPVEWVIVNDGSIDRTVDIIQEYEKQFNWISHFNAKDPGISEISARIAYLVNYGFSKLTADNYRFILKLDGDVVFDNDFAENIIKEFLAKPKLGIASGLVEYEGKKEINSDPTLTRGAAKFYRRQCWEDIGGLYLSRGWDTVDNYAAQYYGWSTRSLNLYFRHCKQEGKRSGLIKWHYWTGLYNGRVPYHPLYFILKLLRHTLKKPIFIGSIIQLYGFLLAAYFRKERPFPKELSVYIRALQLKKIKQAFKVI